MTIGGDARTRRPKWSMDQDCVLSFGILTADSSTTRRILGAEAPQDHLRALSKLISSDQR
jgi:hypothetical protein